MWRDLGKAVLATSFLMSGCVPDGEPPGLALRHHAVAYDVETSGLSPTEFCRRVWQVGCDLEFRCTDMGARNPTFIANYGGSVIECQALTQASAACAFATCQRYDEEMALACLQQLSRLPCAGLAGLRLPLACIGACR